jgi:hypothetical protein
MTFPSTVQKAGSKLRQGLRRSVARTSLDSDERYNAEVIWRMQLGSKGQVTSLLELMQLLERLQIPMQPVIRQVVEAAFLERAPGQFTFSDFVLVLEQCKTLHLRWLHKVRGKTFDDDLLEAYIAVGGESDSTGEVDLKLMNSVVKDFNLELPALKNVTMQHGAHTDSGNSPAANKLEFQSFVGMLRGNQNALFTPQLFLVENEMDEDGVCDATPTASNSRRHSMFGRKGSGTMKPGTLPPLHNVHDGGAGTPKGADRHQPLRSQTSFERSMLPPSDRSPRGSPLRTSSKASGVSRLPLLNRQRREKKPKFANW